ncbi:hypothetical protein P9112_000684 [Eukaryota sp. TZLM1-RC]
MTIGFSFDIDGVLLKSGVLLPGVKETLLHIIEHNIPHMFLTNSAACTADEKAAQLSKLFGVDIPGNRVILSHSPIGFLQQKYQNDVVAVVGRPNCKHILKSHGYQNVLSSLDICSLIPDIYPYKKYTSDEELDSSLLKRPIKALFVANDCFDWQRDLQICLDILTSNGIIGTSSPTQVIDLYFSNPDYVYSARYPLPRMTMGSFTLCLKSLYHHQTGQELKYTQFGKPHEVQFNIAEKVLRSQGATKFVMIDDNPLSGIKGANMRSNDWTSVLPLTGVAKGNSEENPADFVFDDVNEAVAYFLKE